MRRNDICCIFASLSGVTGFDSKMNCHGSMPSTVAKLVNLGCKQLIGENNYALAA